MILAVHVLFVVLLNDKFYFVRKKTESLEKVVNHASGGCSRSQAVLLVEVSSQCHKFARFCYYFKLHRQLRLELHGLTHAVMILTLGHW